MLALARSEPGIPVLPAELDAFPAPEERPDFYVDFDETGPFSAEVGAGECAGV